MREFLVKAAKAYYEGTPIISDVEFDILAKETGFNEVGYTDLEYEFEHLYPMYSLQKAFVGDNRSPIPESLDTIVTPKLDGAAVSLGYYDGELVLALTRGDGKRGRNIASKMQHLIPTKIPNKGIVQITGEVVAKKSIPNARNYAAGALNLKSQEDFKQREVRFIAYDVQPKTTEYWSTSLAELVYFDTVLDSNWEDYPQDGVVFRVDSVAEFEGLGYTAHHPRGAFALKEKAEGVETTLLDVVWQTGKSGVISPVAILDPIKIGAAVITKATLHNIEYIRELNLEIGCRVEVIRSGEIIPRVVKRVG
ncbi:MAG TPA: DNA ligase [Flavobacteriales bacterium]|jgi:DNA ligase (NAD+)|nr:DNA ligase [Flavobacteriales bacterium]